MKYTIRMANEMKVETEEEAALRLANENTFVDISKFEKNPDCQFGGWYWTVCEMTTDGEVIGEVARIDNKTDAFDFAGELADELGIPVFGECLGR